MSFDSASPNRVAEEVYPTLWCWISFLRMESSTYNNANSIPRIRDGAMRYRWTDNPLIDISYLMHLLLLLV